jgi:indole-3-glycerol phosphate synthase
MLGMTALVEVHTLEELDRVLQLPATLLGINNRDLEDFSVNLQTTEQLLAARSEQIRAKEMLIVSESGLYTSADLYLVYQCGADAVLIGESLVKQPDPAAAITHLFAEQSKQIDNISS